MNATAPTRALRALIPLLFVAFAGCATKGDLRNVTNELRMVRASQDSLLSALARQARITQDSLRGTSAQIVDVRGTVNQQLGRMQEELAMVRQENAQLTRALTGIRDQMERLIQAQSSSAPTGYPMPGAPGGGGGTGAAEQYNAAHAAMNNGRYQTARMAFEEVVQTYPNDPMAANAAYALADMLLRENKKDEAIAAFEKVANDYPTSPVAPDALFQMGEILRDLQRRTEARTAYERIVGSYGNSPAAVRAQERLREPTPG
jgi:tol-pal system protein YbgF